MLAYTAITALPAHKSAYSCSPTGLSLSGPGRLPNTVKISKLTTGTSFSRNPLLVRLLENLGYMDKLGRGLPMVYQEARKLGRTLEFKDEGEEFRVILGL